MIDPLGMVKFRSCMSAGFFARGARQMELEASSPHLPFRREGGRALELFDVSASFETGVSW